MANHDPDKEMFDQVKESIKKLGEVLTQWQQKESAIQSLAENSAKQAGAQPEEMDAQVYVHKKMIKKAMAEKAKQEEEQMTPPGEGAEAQSPQPPMAGQAGNTGANSWEHLNMPTPYPGQVQQGPPIATPEQRPMPSMPTPPVPGGFSNPNAMGAY